MQVQKTPASGPAGVGEVILFVYEALEKCGIINGALVGDLALQVVH